MDNITHTLFALTLARTRLRPEGPAGRATTAVLLLSSNAADIDIVAAFSGGPGSYLAAHRGATHGPLGVAALAIACAGLVALADTWRSRRFGDGGTRRGFVRLTLVAALGVILHIAMDLPTPYGTRVLSPFSSRWFAFDWLPIIDIVLWIILAGGLMIGRGLHARRHQVAMIVLALMAAHYAVHAAGHAAAVTQSGGTAPWRIATWNGDAPRACDEGPSAPCASLAAIPTFDEAVFWNIVRPTRNGYTLFGANVWKGTRGDAKTIRNEENAWTSLARASRLGGIFYAFSRFPAARVSAASDGASVRVQDLRYTGPLVNDEVRSPFVAVIDIDRHGQVRRERLGR